MGRIVRQLSEGTTRHYWYPGEKREWIRAAVAVGLGLAAFGLIMAVTRDLLPATVVGTSITGLVSGLNFGRRDARALAGFPDLGAKAARRAAVGHTGRAVWRALAHGFGGAAAAVLIVNLPDRGVLADWILPVVPTVVGALAHQGGMLYERLGTKPAPAEPVPGLVPGSPTDTLETIKSADR